MEQSSRPARADANGFRILPGWRVGRAPDQSVTRGGLLVPAGSEDSQQALTLVDIRSGERFWAAPKGAWKFIWPPSGEVVVPVHESQVIAEEEGPVPDQSRYL